jgi:hypothetical protein
MRARQGATPGAETSEGHHQEPIDGSTLEIDSATIGDFAYEWRECPDHPWYGVSVMVTGEHAVCVPPLDGTPTHPEALQ